MVFRWGSVTIFGEAQTSLTYGTNKVVTQVDLRHIDEARGTNVVELGVDLSEFYTSVEWDILEVPAIRYTLSYTRI